MDTHASPVPVPTDTPLDVVADAYDDRGLDGQFDARSGGLLHCDTCGADTPAAQQSANDVTRLEGPSDPGDMQIIVPVQCPVCRTKGILICNYGPEASAEEAEVLQAMTRDAPHDHPVI